MKKMIIKVCAALCLFTASRAFAAPKTHTVVDHAGNTVEVPNKIDRIVIASLYPLPSVYCLYADSAKKLVGIPASSMAAAKASFLVKAYPEIANAKTGFEKGGVINAEELMALKPDVIFYNAGAKSSNGNLRRRLFNVDCEVQYDRNLCGVDRSFGKSARRNGSFEKAYRVRKKNRTRCQSSRRFDSRRKKTECDDHLCVR